MSAWSHLPNTKHIDRVLASVRSNPHRWSDAYDAEWNAARNAARDAAYAAARDAAWNAARDAAWNAAYDAARNAAWNAAWVAARNAARDAVWGAARVAAWVTARDALYALIAWDDCAYLLDLPPDAVRLIAASGIHAAVMLLPAVIALQGEEK